MASNLVGVVIVLLAAFGNICDAALCYECSEYDNFNRAGPVHNPNLRTINYNNTSNLSSSSSTSTGIEPRISDRLCHNLDDTLLIRCYGDCLRAVKRTSQNVFLTFRTCAQYLECNNPGFIQCERCSSDRCNSKKLQSNPDSAASIGVSAVFMAASLLISLKNFF